jgi:hypothetical protein
MTPTAAALGADVRATPTVRPRLRGCMIGNGASSRKKCDVRQKYISQFHERPPAAPGDPLIIVESRLKSVSVWLLLIEIDIRLPVLRPKRLIEKEKLYEVARVRP